MRVDVQKLGAVREVVDLWLVEAALDANLSRLGAAAAMADRIGFALRLLPVKGGWVVYAVSRDVWRRALSLATQGATISATGTELLEREPWHYESGQRDDAIVATLCRLLDENIDVDAGDGQRPMTSGGAAGHGARYAAMGVWFEAVKQQWATLAAMQRERTKQQA